MFTMPHIFRKISFTVCTFLIATSFVMTFNVKANETAKSWQLNTQNGDVISLEQYKNKPIILHFWATWCPYCKKIQPSLVALQKKYQSEGVELISISFNEDEGALPQDEINRRGYTFLTAVMGEDVAKLYGVQGTPTTFFINRRNEIIWKTSSSDRADPRFDLALQAIIKK